MTREIARPQRITPRPHDAGTRWVRRFLMLGALASLLAGPVRAAEPAAARPTHVATVEGISEHRFENGLRVLILPDASKPTITVNMTYRVGSRHENLGESGMAHLLEHLLFKGTPTHPDPVGEFTRRGARFNGLTTPDFTSYFALLPASDDNLAWVIGLEADRMLNARIAKQDLDTEMTVVRNEFELGESDPINLMYKRLQSVAFDWHGYGRPTIGNRSDIENVPIERLQSFYRTHYQPDNAVLVVAGRFDPARALDLVTDAFGRMARPARILPAEWSVEPTQDGERSFTVRRKDGVQMVWVAYKVPSNLHPHAAALGLAAKVLGDAPSGRLHKALVEGGRATQVLALDLTGHAPGLQIFGAMVKPGESIEPVRDALIAQLETFGDTPAAADELERARLAARNQLDRMQNDHEVLGRSLSDYIALGDWRLFFRARQALGATGAAELADVAQRYYRRDNRTVGIYLPEDQAQRAEIPAAPPVAELIAGLELRAAGGEAEAFDPSPANLDARTRLVELHGLKVALLAKRSRGQAVAVHLRLNLGDERSLRDRQAVRELTEAMIGRGTTRMSRAALADARERLGMGGEWFGFQTDRERLAQALGLAAHAMRDASFPQPEFDRLKKETLARLEAQRSDPFALATTAIDHHANRYPPGDPRHTPTLEQRMRSLEAVSLDDVRRFHREFYGASNAQLAIVGDFDAEAIVPVIEKAFDGWKSPRPYARLRWRHAESAPVRLLIDTPDKENAVIHGRLDLAMNDEAPDHAALLVANAIFGGSPGSRLMERLRQQDGLSYGAGSGLQVSPWDDAGFWVVGAVSAPMNAGRVEAAIREEIARARRDGFSAAETETAIGFLLQLRAQERAQDPAVAQTWLDHLERGRRWTSWTGRLDAQIRAVTPEDAWQAFRRHIRPEALSLAIAADQAASKRAGR